MKILLFGPIVFKIIALIQVDVIPYGSFGP